MSTTFYRIDREKKQLFLDRISEVAKTGETDVIIDVVESRDFEVEIGLRSSGWKFLWRAHNLKYFNDRESLFEWLKGGQIKDEYGKEYTFEEFMKEIEYFIYNGYDLSEWYYAHPDRIRYTENYLSLESKKGEIYQPNEYGEFYIDGLRFTAR